MKVNLRFFGVFTRVGEIELKFLGQKVALDEGLYRDAVTGGASLLPEQDFDSIFPEEVVRKYRQPGMRHKASDEFSGALAKAVDRLAEIRGGFLNPKPVAKPPFVAAVEKEARKEANAGK